MSALTKIAAIVIAISATLPAQQPAGIFSSKIYPMLESAKCRMCHNDNGVASATRLLFPPEESNPEAIEAFGLKLSALVDRKNPEESLLLRKPTARMEHGGGPRIVAGSPREETLRQWVQQLARMPEADLRTALDRLGGSQKKTAKAGAMRRLTHSQYNHTVRDLLGDFTRPADQFPQEDFLNGFTNQVEGQSVSPILAEAYTVAAEKLAANAFRRGDSTGIIPCKPASASDIACRDRFIRDFGLRAFRRPLTIEETRAYQAMFGRAASAQSSFLC